MFSFVIEEREKNQVSFYNYWREKDTPPPFTVSLTKSYPPFFCDDFPLSTQKLRCPKFVIVIVIIIVIVILHKNHLLIPCENCRRSLRGPEVGCPV